MRAEHVPGAGADKGPVAAGLFSPRTGIITGVERLVSDLLPGAMVAMTASLADMGALPPAVRSASEVNGFGAGLNSDDAWWNAIGEAVDRYGALVGSRTVALEWGSYRELEADAVHGAAFALPSATEIVPPFAAFDERRVRGWVVGHDLGDDRDVLVPAHLALARYVPRHDGERLAPWTTNGVAAHTTKPDAVLAGLREVQERDAFMIRYLNRWSPPELPVTGVSADVDRLLDSVPSWFRARVRAWDLTLDLGQPVVLAAVLPENEDLPPINVGAACRADHRSALLKALFEAFQMIPWKYVRGYPAAATPEPIGPIATIEDHVRLTCCPGYRATLGWLLDEPVTAPRIPHAVEPECPTTLDAAVDAVRRRGHRVIVVDLTPPDVRDLGWYVCNVLVPGTQPLCFGRIQRLQNDRLYDLPVTLGHRGGPVRERDLNPVPHPFT